MPGPTAASNLPARETASPPLTARGVRKRFGRLQVLQGVDLELQAGSVLGLLGLNGSGKTTTLRCVLGLTRFDSGEVSIRGRSPGRLHRSRGEVGVAFDEAGLPPHLTVRQALEHARLLSGPRSLPAAELEERLGLGPYRSVRVRRLSRGNLRRAAVACALVGRPSLAILDEPFSGLDAGGVDDLAGLIRDLPSGDTGASVLLASHQLAYVEGVCSHVAILHGGRIRVAGSLPDVLRGRPTRLWLRTSRPDAASEAISARGDVRSAALEPDGRIRVELDGADPGDLNRDLVRAGFAVRELVPRPPSLDAVFRDVTSVETA